jgi:hypothetical protein
MGTNQHYLEMSRQEWLFVSQTTQKVWSCHDEGWARSPLDDRERVVTKRLYCGVSGSWRVEIIVMTTCACQQAVR